MRLIIKLPFEKPFFGDTYSIRDSIAWKLGDQMLGEVKGREKYSANTEDTCDNQTSIYTCVLSLGHLARWNKVQIKFAFKFERNRFAFENKSKLFDLTIPCLGSAIIKPEPKILPLCHGGYREF